MLRKILGGLKSLTRSLKGGSSESKSGGTHGHGAHPTKAGHGHGGSAKTHGGAGRSGEKGPRTERAAGTRSSSSGPRRDEPRREERGRGEHSRSGSSGRHGGGHGGGRLRERGPAPRRDYAEEHAAPLPVELPPMPEVPADNTFFGLGLRKEVVAAVFEKGYTEPTPIQARAIPLVLAGRDLIGTAQTGTGKTAAFALPILHRLGGHGRCRCLILEPTRELALQVEEAFRTYGKFTGLRVAVVYGGVGYGKQREELQRGVDVIVATPGRLLDLLGDGTCRLGDLEVLVLDEVDRMLDMGFLPDVRRIIRHVPAQRQTLLFSATLPPEIQGLAQSVLTNPETIEIGIRSSPAETVDHAFYPVVAAQKFELLCTLLERTEYKSVIVFTRTKIGADKIAHRLHALGLKSGVMHSDRSQRERTEALDGFKSGRFQMLVATDLAARGLDIRGVTHVINYDMPENPEDYVHRIGRTGRANNEGDAYTLMTEEDLRNARSIERLIGRSVPRRKVDGFNYLYSALFEEQEKAVAAPKTVSRLSRGRR
ncbi:MAG TPA: DEAD/DEAH box helicase [Opitutaceae bacterium]|nr:DEAD/DEAH box helicase [Opitutaceae bacterium]